MPDVAGKDAPDVRFDRAHSRELFEKYAKERDAESREDLVVAHLNLVRFLALKFANRGEPLDDLVQVGTLGLIKAIDRFDPNRGVEFTTYATPTIVGEIKRHFRDKGWAVKVPRRLQELNLAVNKAVEQMAITLGRAPTVADLSERLHSSEEEIIEAQELGQAYNVLSLDVDLTAEGRTTATLLDYVGSDDAQLALSEDRAALERAFTALDKRERIILYLRYFENLTQSDIAKRLSVSQMHVSRLQARALDKLKKQIRAD